MKIGRNMWGRPLIATGVTSTNRKCLEVNPGGRWFSALWIFGSELILAFNVFGFSGAIYWRAGRGWKPEIKRFENQS